MYIVHVNVYMWAYGYVYLSMFTWRPNENVSYPFLSLFTLLSWDRIWLSSSGPFWVSITCPVFYVGGGDLNSGPFDYTVIILIHGATSPAPVVNTVKMLWLFLHLEWCWLWGCYKSSLTCDMWYVYHRSFIMKQLI